MGWFGVLFLIFGWVFNVKGLVITALILSSLFFLINFIGIVLNVKSSKVDIILHCCTLILCIVRLCM